MAINYINRDDPSWPYWEAEVGVFHCWITRETAYGNYKWGIKAGGGDFAVAQGDADSTQDAQLAIQAYLTNQMLLIQKELIS